MDSVKNFFTNRYYFEFTDYCVDEFLPDNFTIIRLSKLKNTKIKNTVVNRQLLAAVQTHFPQPVRATAYISDSYDMKNSLSAYLMFDKLSDLYEVRETINQFDSIQMSVIDAYSIPCLPKAVLSQLLVGLMKNEENEDDVIFNNTMGTTLVWNQNVPNDKWTDTTQHYSEGKPTWNGKIFLGCDTHTAIEIKMNEDGILYPRTAPFVKAKPDVAKIANLYFPYKIDNFWGIIPATKKDKQKQFWFRQGQAQNPAQLPFLSYDSYKKFKMSRMGILADFLEQVDEELGNGRPDGPLMIVHPHAVYDINNIEQIAVKSSTNNDLFLNACKSLIGGKLAISYMDDVEMTDKNKMGYELLCEVINEMDFGKFKTEYDHKKLNIVICHDAEFYKNKTDLTNEFKKNHTKDVIQRITIENLMFDTLPLLIGDDDEKQESIDDYNKKRNDKKKQISHMVKMCMFSLGIKQCIIKKKPDILMDALTDDIKNRFDKPLSAAVKIPFKIEQGDKTINNPLFLVVNLDFKKNKVSFRYFQQDQRYHSSDNYKISDGFNNIDNNSYHTNYDPNIEMIVWEDIDDIHQIRLTDEHIIPNLKAVKKNLKDVTKSITKAEFVEYLDDFIDCQEEEIQKNEAIAYKNHVVEKMESKPDPISYSDIQKSLDSKGKGLGSIYRQFSAFLETKGLRLVAKVRNSTTDENFGYGVVNFNKILLLPTPPTINNGRNNSYTYMVGSKKSLLQGGIDKGFPLRQVVRLNEKEINPQFVRNILSMTKVDFVRINQWTVTPFTKKLLYEYAQLVIPTLEDGNNPINWGSYSNTK